MNWIKTSERFPEVDGRVLVIERGSVVILSYNSFHECWDGDDEDDYHCDLDKIEYWMPLPKTIRELEIESENQ